MTASRFMHHQGAAALALLACLGALPAQADCALCPKAVTLSDDLARCYLHRVTDVLSEANRLGLPLALFDLTDCPVETSRKGLALPEPRRVEDTDAAPQVDTRFVLTGDLAECLATRLRADLTEMADLRRYIFAQDCARE